MVTTSFRAWGLVVVVALALGGCGGGGGDNTSAAPSGEATTAAEKATTTTDDPAATRDEFVAAVQELTDACSGAIDEGETMDASSLVDDVTSAYEKLPASEQGDAELKDLLSAVAEVMPHCDPESAEPLTEATGTVAESPDGEYDLNCDYVLEPSYRFIGGGTIENTGNIGIRVRVTYKWRLLGQGSHIEQRTYRLKPGQSREVDVSVPATGEQISAHQSADSDCKTSVKMLDTFGQPE
jgi:hypothetical protein